MRDDSAVAADTAPADQIFGDYSLNSFQQETSDMQRIEVAAPVTPEQLSRSARRCYQMAAVLAIGGVCAIVGAFMAAHGTAPGPLVAQTVDGLQDAAVRHHESTGLVNTLMEGPIAFITGPIGFTIGLLGMLVGAFEIMRGDIALGAPATVGSAVIIKAGGIFKLMGAESGKVSTQAVDAARMLPSTITTWDFTQNIVLVMVTAFLALFLTIALALTGLQRHQKAQELLREQTVLADDE